MVQIQKEERLNSVGLQSGFKNLDHQTLGFQNGQLTLIAGRATIDLTALVANISSNIVKQDHKRVAIFSLDQMLKKFSEVFSEKDIAEAYINGNINHSKMPQFSILIDTTSKISIFDLMYRSLNLVQNHGIDIFFIDYLQLIKGFKGKSKKEKRKNLEKITKLLKFMAASLNIPVVLISELPRKLEKRTGFKIPVIDDLNVYGNIRKYCSTILFLYQWRYYGFVQNEQGEDLSDRALIVIAKTFHGHIGNVELRHDFENGIFIEKE